MKQVDECEKKQIEVQCNRDEELWMQDGEIPEICVDIDSYNRESISEKNRDNNVEICKCIANIEKYIHWRRTSDDCDRIS